jgi:hypothetical protein
MALAPLRDPGSEPASCPQEAHAGAQQVQQPPGQVGLALRCGLPQRSHAAIHWAPPETRRQVQHRAPCG